ncbi:Ninja-family protein 1 [Platanthera guangdongensis]|uniref:Ninja-family protein n=1 Tax=Platanthera guangdongensis TaxID=2320717 RepID=A0ABR2MDN8_9ASPA
MSNASPSSSGLEFLGFRSGSNGATVECRDKRVPLTSKPANSAERNIVMWNRGQGSANGSGEVLTSSMEDMPSVSTRGAGPNGRRIEGFLYRYGRGEDVSIVCVCHGSFLTPAEFVKHAGGGDVAHPLRHIVVNPSPDVFSS